VMLTLASLVAGLATTPYAAFHFHRMTPYGVLANLAAMPVVSAWVMPMGLFGLLAMPFGLDGVFWRLMGDGIDWMIAVALFVAACDAVRQKFKTTVIGVHHTSRNGNMRGSTVFPGAGDFLIEVNREEGAKHGSIKAVKIKAAEDVWEQHFRVEEMQLGDIGGHKSLVVEATAEAPKEETKSGWPDTEVCKQILAAISEQWTAGRPWCFAHNSSRSALANISKRWKLKRSLVADMLSTWTANEVIEEAERDTRNHIKGYRVINEIG